VDNEAGRVRTWATANGNSVRTKLKNDRKRLETVTRSDIAWRSRKKGAKKTNKSDPRVQIKKRGQNEQKQGAGQGAKTLAGLTNNYKGKGKPGGEISRKPRGMGDV